MFQFANYCDESANPIVKYSSSCHIDHSYYMKPVGEQSQDASTDTSVPLQHIAEPVHTDRECDTSVQHIAEPVHTQRECVHAGHGGQVEGTSNSKHLDTFESTHGHLVKEQLNTLDIPAHEEHDQDELVQDDSDGEKPVNGNQDRPHNNSEHKLLKSDYWNPPTLQEGHVDSAPLVLENGQQAQLGLEHEVSVQDVQEQPSPNKLAHNEPVHGRIEHEAGPECSATELDNTDHTVHGDHFQGEPDYMDLVQVVPDHVDLVQEALDICDLGGNHLQQELDTMVQPDLLEEALKQAGINLPMDAICHDNETYSNTLFTIQDPVTAHYPSLNSGIARQQERYHYTNSHKTPTQPWKSNDTKKHIKRKYRRWMQNAHRDYGVFNCHDSGSLTDLTRSAGTPAKFLHSEVKSLEANTNKCVSGGTSTQMHHNGNMYTEQHLLQHKEPPDVANNDHIRTMSYVSQNTSDHAYLSVKSTMNDVSHNTRDHAYLSAKSTMNDVSHNTRDHAYLSAKSTWMKFSQSKEPNRVHKYAPVRETLTDFSKSQDSDDYRSHDSLSQDSQLAWFKHHLANGAQMKKNRGTHLAVRPHYIPKPFSPYQLISEDNLVYRPT